MPRSWHQKQNCSENKDFSGHVPRKKRCETELLPCSPDTKQVGTSPNSLYGGLIARVLLWDYGCIDAQAQKTEHLYQWRCWHAVTGSDMRSMTSLAWSRKVPQPDWSRQAWFEKWEPKELRFEQAVYLLGWCNEASRKWSTCLLHIWQLLHCIAIQQTLHYTNRKEAWEVHTGSIANHLDLYSMHLQTCLGGDAMMLVSRSQASAMPGTLLPWYEIIWIQSIES